MNMNLFPEHISVISGGNELTEQAAENEKISVKITADGTVTVKSANVGVSFVKLFFKRVFSGSALIYGDCFERGYGDLSWKEDRRDLLHWYFIAADGGNFYGCGVKTQPNALCAWRVHDKEIELTCDVRNGTDKLQFKEEFPIAQLAFKTGSGNLHDFCRSFCNTMCDAPRSCRRPVFGANDWYCNYGDSSAQKILRAAKFAVKCADGLPYKPFMVIDDGWQKNHDEDFNGGEWDEANDRFSDMAKLASDIDAAGAIPGIWFRPLQSKIQLPNECFSDRENLFLDPSHPKTLKTVKNDIARFYKWGFKLVKFDFVTYDIFYKWGFEIPENYFSTEKHFFDKTKTTAQIIKDFYKVIRSAAPDDLLLLGCNAIGHLAAGIIDIQRTGDDTSGESWERTRKMGVNTLAFRSMQHGTFFDADADCVGFTDKVPFEMSVRWLDVVSKSSTPLFVSVAEANETPQTARAVAEAFNNAVFCRNISKPLDWLDSLTPHEWQSDMETDSYDWNTK